ncbi:MAG: TspO/MBR family protein [Aestuariivirgaceae bacterium]
MPNAQADRRKPGHDVAGLLVFIVICLAVSGLGGAVTAQSVGTWYPTLIKPSFNPPNWIFGPVWAMLYLLMAIAGWRVWRASAGKPARWALAFFAGQLVLNLAWSFVFFGLRRIDLAFGEIALLLVVIIVTSVLFWRIDRWAGMLFVPYVLWVGFAAVLNGSLWYLNAGQL